MLTKVPIVQPPDWTRDFHVFVDASDIANGSALMRLSATGIDQCTMHIGSFQRLNATIQQQNGRL